MLNACWRKRAERGSIIYAPCVMVSMLDASSVGWANVNCHSVPLHVHSSPTVFPNACVGPRSQQRPELFGVGFQGKHADTISRDNVNRT
eukprot:364496-Chlamydomonas_euryale.AAC.43